MPSDMTAKVFKPHHSLLVHHTNTGTCGELDAHRRPTQRRIIACNTVVYSNEYT